MAEIVTVRTREQGGKDGWVVSEDRGRRRTGETGGQ